MGRREQLATLLARAGGPATILHVRGRLRIPVLSVLTYHHVCEPSRDYGYDPDTARAIKSFISVAAHNGQAGLSAAGYVPLPDRVKERLIAAIDALQ